MLSADLADWNMDLTKVPYPIYSSPKVDGIRCVIQNGRAMSRSGKRIPNDYVNDVLSIHDNNLDGELVVWDISTNRSAPYHITESQIMSKWTIPNFKYLVFDYVQPGLYLSRLAALTLYCHSQPVTSVVQLLDQTMCHNADELRQTYERQLSHGWEGTMLRRHDRDYKHGRSTLNEFGLVKLKPWVTDEARIQGFIEELENTNELTKDSLGYADRSTNKAGMVPKGRLGSFVVSHPTFGEFNIGGGPGLTHELRAEYWRIRDTLINIRVKFKHLSGPTSGYSKPRSPQFLGLCRI